MVFAVQVGDALRVYVRNGDAELRQVAQTLVVHADVDPTRLVTLVADLDSSLGWSGPAATAGDRVLGHPAVSPATARQITQPTPKPARPVPPVKAAKATTPADVAGRGARFRRLLEQAPPEGLTRTQLARHLGYSPGAMPVSKWVREGLADGWLVKVNVGGGPTSATFRAVNAPGGSAATDDTPQSQRAAILAEITRRHPEPVSAADLGHLFPDRAFWRTGTMHNRLGVLVDKGLVVRTGEPGSYRWALTTSAAPVAVAGS